MKKRGYYFEEKIMAGIIIIHQINKFVILFMLLLTAHDSKVERKLKEGSFII